MHLLRKKTKPNQKNPGITVFHYQAEKPDGVCYEAAISAWDSIKKHIKGNQSPRCVLCNTTLGEGRQWQSNLAALLLVNNFQRVCLGKKITQKTTDLV